MNKLKTALFALLVAASLAGQAFADAIALPDNKAERFFSDPLVVVIIAAVIVVAALIVAGAIRTARKNKPKKRDPRD